MSTSTRAELIPIDSIIVPERLRNDVNNTDVPGHIESLKESIERYGGAYSGLLQPILINDHNELQDGWCRYRACKELGWNFVPCYVRERLSETEYHEIELECNIRRMPFTWQEVVRQVVRIHDNRWRAAALTGKKWTSTMTGVLLGGYGQTYVDNCRRLAPLIHLERYQACDGITDAIRLYLRDKEDAAVAEQARRLQLVKATPQAAAVRPPDAMSCIACEGTGTTSRGERCPICRGNGWTAQYNKEASPAVETNNTIEVSGTYETSHEVNLSGTLFHGNCLGLLAEWPVDCVDHIISDPPYAIDMDNLDQETTSLMDVSTVRDTHVVSDNLTLYATMFPHLYRVLRTGGYCILWCDIENWHVLCHHAASAGFKVQRWPIVWYKTSICKNQMAHVNLTKNFELAIVLRKGNARLPKPVGSSVIVAPTSTDKVRNPFAKPYDVWKFCYEAVSTAGQTVLDPFAGEGSSVIAGLRLNRQVLAIEIGDDYNYMIEKVREYWATLLKGNVTYV